ncbi:MAG: DUF3800 domain-containing protein [Capsulimonas sp.]|uniref:DUF3800 domain-containing protein n=1 Tax=Capsulimonas sp. TaxID=2494211 RepID=UPI0032668FD3
MAYFLFVDESGQDHRESPYEVLAGVAVEDRDLWNLVTALQTAELRIFGMRYSAEERELKATKLLRAKTYRLAHQLPAFPEEERRELARRCLENGPAAGKRELTALAQAKLAYVQEVLNICARFRCRVFASIVSPNAIRPASTNLRKDYVYLFERFFYFLEDQGPGTSGIVVFDELEKSQSHILVGQMDRYFKLTTKGQQRAGLIIPEPFFVHSDLTTGVQIADIVAYVVSWGVRYGEMNSPARQELQDLATSVRQMRYRIKREVDDNPDFTIWSFTLITDLRPKNEKL